MTNSRVLDALKGALLLEYRGKEIYESVIKNSSNADVQELFGFLRDEEQNHIRILQNNYRQVLKGNEPDFSGEAVGREESVNEILTDRIVQAISGAGYEAAVISSALDLEKKAVEYYKKKENEAESAGEEALFHWLVEWEKGHMMMLVRLDDELREKIWYDNNFWPLD